MSLLNDALRKKDREKQSQGKIAGRPTANPVPRHKRRRLYWLTGIGSVLVLAIGIGIGLVVHSIEAPSVLALESAPDISTRHRVAEDTPPLAEKPASGAAAKSVSFATEIRAGELKTTPDAPKDKMLDTEDIRPEVVHPPVLSEEAASPEPNLQLNDHEVSAGSHVDGSGQIASVSAAVQTTKNNREALRPSEQVSQAERYYRKALSYHRQGRVHRAIALYRQVVQLQPHHFDARFNLVSAYIHTREFTKAHRIAVELYHQDGTNQQVLSNLAIAKIGMGQSREALQLLDQVVDFPQTSMFTVYLHKGIAYRSLNQMDAAIGWYKKAEELKPDDPQLLFNLALAYDRQQQYGEAAHYYQAYLPQAEIDESISEKDIRRRIHTLRSYLAEEAAQEQNVK